VLATSVGLLLFNTWASDEEAASLMNWTHRVALALSSGISTQRAHSKLCEIRKWENSCSSPKSEESRDLTWEDSEMICSCKPDISRISILLRSLVICPFILLTLPSIYLYAGSIWLLSAIISNSRANIGDYTTIRQTYTHCLTEDISSLY